MALMVLARESFSTSRSKSSLAIEKQIVCKLRSFTLTTGLAARITASLPLRFAAKRDLGGDPPASLR